MTPDKPPVQSSGRDFGIERGRAVQKGQRGGPIPDAIVVRSRQRRSVDLAQACLAHDGSLVPVMPVDAERHTAHHGRMTMLSFRVDDDEAARAQQWAEQLAYRYPHHFQ